MGCGGGLATAANFRTVPKFSAESIDASQRLVRVLHDSGEITDYLL